MNNSSTTENPIVVTSFYHLMNLPNFENIKDPLLDFCKNLEMKGTILLAKEGINATISGTRESMNACYDYILNKLNIPVTNFKESFTDFKPFLKMKVRLKKEIVAMGVYDLDTDKYRGEYLDSNQWIELLQRDDVVLIDTRNKYEVKLGTFQNAIDPKIQTFREFPEWIRENQEILKNKKIAMFCTGGVRCEKTTAYMKQEGYNDVYHLKGGIIKYFEETKNESGIWEGNCFVFDDRVAVNDQLNASDDLVCSICDAPMTTDDVRDTSAFKRVVCIKCHNEEILQKHGKQ